MSMTDAVTAASVTSMAGATHVPEPTLGRPLLKGADIGLKRRIQELDEAMRETGHLFGIERLELMESDPIKFDKFQWRIFAAVRLRLNTPR